MTAHMTANNPVPRTSCWKLLLLSSLVLCLPSYVALLIHLGAWSFLDGTPAVQLVAPALTPLYFAGTLGAHLFLPMAAACIAIASWKGRGTAPLAALAWLVWFGAVCATWYVVGHEKWG